MKLEGVDLLDGHGWRRGIDLEIAHGRVAAIRPGTRRKGAPVICPAPLDLQVNGGGGRMLGEAQAPGDVLEILAAHRRLGTGAILPTLISDTPETTERVIHLVATARQADDGILGLHLEGPHIARPGAHDPARLRDLTAADIAAYIGAKSRLGHLLVTLAPERATTAQIAELAEAGIIVSLGHTDCSHAQAEAAFEAGARMTTHLFNAMSGLHHREPGLVGAALTSGHAYGLIADGHHVADAALRVALAAHPEGAIPVSDAMAIAGTDAADFTLGDRRVHRRDGRLTLDDGTLAGADLSLLDGLRHIARVTGQPLTGVLPMGFDRPHRLLTGKPNTLTEGTPARILFLEDDRIEGFDGHAWHVLPDRALRPAGGASRD
jgi:N-acetylglucosamine-6-phosphate deacetylase